MTHDQLRAFRKRDKLSQRDAAKRTGTGGASWNSWEGGKIVPPSWMRIVVAAVDAGVA